MSALTCVRLPQGPHPRIRVSVVQSWTVSDFHCCLSFSQSITNLNIFTYWCMSPDVACLHPRDERQNGGLEPNCASGIGIAHSQLCKGIATRNKGIATRSKKPLGALGRTTRNKGTATSNKGIATRSKKLLGAPGPTTRNKGTATSNKGIATRSKSY